jgi:hypothetical protein
VLILCGNAFPQNGSSASPLPDQFAIGRPHFSILGRRTIITNRYSSGRRRYPPIAKVAHIESTVHFTVDVDADGRATNFNVESGHPMLRAVTEKAMSGWKFPRDAVGQRIHAAVEFATNCVAKKQ